jgi:L-lactate dehydrogenase
MLPLGGLDLGHKGFALGLIVEVLTAGLAGSGRADKPDRSGGTPVFAQLIDPDAFGGKQALRREAGWLADACRASKPLEADRRVRMPGDTAARLRREQLESGVALHPAVMPPLADWAQKLGVQAP